MQKTSDDFLKFLLTKKRLDAFEASETVLWVERHGLERLNHFLGTEHSSVYDFRYIEVNCYTQIYYTGERMEMFRQFLSWCERS